MISGEVVLAVAPGHVSELVDAAGVVWLVAACESALAMVLAWRISGRSSEIWVAACLLVVGVSGPVAHHVSSINPDGTTAWLVRTGLVLLGATYLVQARRDHDVVSTLADRVTLVRAAAPVLGVLAIMMLVAVTLPRPTFLLTTVVLVATSALLCTSAARLTGLDRTVRRGLIAAFILEAAGRLLLLTPVDVDTPSPPLTSVAVGLLGAGAGVIVIPGISCFRSAVAGARVRSHRLKTEADALAANQKDESRRRHDARGALAAVQLANEVLLQRADGLDPHTRAEMAAGVRDELRRVAALLQAGSVRPWRAIDEIMDVVDEVRARGGAVAAEVGDLTAVQEPLPLRPILRLLLEIVTEAAPGREFRLRAEAGGGAAGVLTLELCPARPIRDKAVDIDAWEAWSELLFLVHRLGGTLRNEGTRLICVRLPLHAATGSPLPSEAG
jgi:hypothetical protein